MPSIILASHGRITTHFHQDIGRGFLHRGIDQGHTNATAYDLQIMAPADGVVTFAGPFGSYGNVIYIEHADGWVSVLAHHRTQHVRKGDRVTQGQIIAVMGNTGTKYVHSHQELRDENANQLDPLLHVGTASTAATDDSPVIITATPTPEEDDMPIYELIETPDRTTWFCVDRILRYGIPGPQYLASYKTFIRSKGQSDAVLQQANGNAFGSPVFNDGAGVTKR